MNLGGQSEPGCLLMHKHNEHARRWAIQCRRGRCRRRSAIKPLCHSPPVATGWFVCTGSLRRVAVAASNDAEACGIMHHRFYQRRFNAVSLGGFGQ